MTTLPSQLGPYTIEREIGRGGMGVVYLGHDTKLDRAVAIKALPEHLAQDAERLARFQREARLLASLTHPNIAGVYGLEEHDGAHYLVMEFVEGESLSDRLSSGAIGVTDAIEFAVQIAAGLEAAHEQGVIHRDLKPGNVVIAPDGSAKILDFGLAKAPEPVGSSVDISQSPTVSVPATPASPTTPGTVLGTAPYMSPEQARGKPLDKRTDIWSFGCVLYEMLSGANPFAGETVSDSIGAILHKEPELGLLPPSTPVRVRELLARTLEKDARRRMRDAGDVMLELEAALAAPVALGDGTGAALPPRRGVGMALSAAVIVGIAAGAGGWWIGRGEIAPESGLIGATFTKLTASGGPELFPSLSPDGDTTYFVSETSGNADIYALRVGGFNPINLTANHPEDDTQPVISPSGDRIAFRSERGGGGIYVMGATGESPRRLTDHGFNPAWSPDGARIVFSNQSIETPYIRNADGELWIVPSTGGEARKMPYEGDAVHPSWSPSGDRIAFWALSEGGGSRDVYTVGVNEKDAVAVTLDAPTDWNPVWSADGRYLYFCSDRGGSMNLWRVAVDQSTGAVKGAFQPVTTGVGSENMHIGLSRDGKRIVYSSLRSSDNIQRLTLDPVNEVVIGTPEWVTRDSWEIDQIDVSPDGRRLAAQRRERQDDLIVMDSDGGNRSLLTNDAEKDRGPQWSPDGSQILFYSDRSGDYEIWKINVDGSGMKQLTETGPGTAASPRWAPDGIRFAFSEPDCMKIVDSSRTWAEQSPVEPILLDDLRVANPEAWSPDGQRLLSTVSTRAAKEMGLLVLLGVESGETELTDRLVHDQAVEWWAGSERVIGTYDQSLFIYNVATGESKELYRFTGPLVSDLTVDTSGHNAFILRTEREADLWLMELQ